MSRFKVRPFSQRNFIACCREAINGAGNIEDKQQVRYLIGYLRDLHCKTILVEGDYVDRDFLDDHSAYYVKCFKEYKSHCHRVHFFSSTITAKQFEDYTKGTVTDLPSLSTANYLGWIVLKPLPETIIGKTCLATYTDRSDRHFYAAFTCTSHILGKTLDVQSVPFQEQDTVLAACATTSVWSALQRTGQMFRHTVPSPSEITSLATQHGAHRGRVFPSLGLELGQMCRAVHSTGLETELREGSRLEDLRGIIYSYGALGLPVILGVNRPTHNEESHAVTVVGYRKPASSSTVRARGFPLVSNSINQLYVHDDQMGPFARARIISSRRLEVTDPLDLNERQKIDIFAVLVPVHRKIRVRYEKALLETTFLEDLLTLGASAAGLPQMRLTWDLRLMNGFALQAEYAVMPEATPQVRSRVLTASLPRFIWRASGLLAGKCVIDLIIDATDVERGFSVHDVIALSSEVHSLIKSVIDNKAWVGDVLSTLQEHEPRGMTIGINQWIPVLRNIA